MENHEETNIIEVTEFKDNGKNKESFGGIGTIFGKLFKCAGAIIKKGNKNYIEARKASEKAIRISLTITVLSLIFLTIPTVILGFIGLLTGYKYSIVGSDVKSEYMNNFFDEMSQSAEDIKRDFKNEFNK